MAPLSVPYEVPLVREEAHGEASSSYTIRIGHSMGAHGASPRAGFYPNDPVAAGLRLTAEQLAKVPGGTVAGLSGYGWIDTLAMPSATWTAAGVTGWATYYTRATP